jgi:HK97 family phage major capsid protein
MALAPKNREANELRAKADALRADLRNPEVNLTPDEVTAKVAEIKSWESRAAVAAEFTPEKEIERQGGDEIVTRTAPEATEDKVEATEYEQIVKHARSAFGGPNGYLLAIARRSAPDAEPWTEKQKAVHQRLVKFHQRTIIGTANDASGGEYLLPLQQVASIFSADIAQAGLLERARRYPVSGRTLRIPVLNQHDASKTRMLANIAATTIVGEAAEKPLREPSFGQRLLTVYKWAAYTELGDEILADDFTGDLVPTVQQAVGGQLVNDINASITVDGTGSSQPLGALHANNAALHVVNRTTSQTVALADVLEMDARFMDGPGSFWLAHVSLKPAIYGLTLGSNTLVSFLTDLRGAPAATLMGKPIIWTHLSALKGVQGDLALINPAFYAVAMRTALTVESSIHYKFRDDITAYRFFARAGGIPIPTEEYSYKAAQGNAVYKVSPFVALGDDVAS